VNEKAKWVEQQDSHESWTKREEIQGIIRNKVREKVKLG